MMRYFRAFVCVYKFQSDIVFLFLYINFAMSCFGAIQVLPEIGLPMPGVYLQGCLIYDKDGDLIFRFQPRHPIVPPKKLLKWLAPPPTRILTRPCRPSLSSVASLMMTFAATWLHLRRLKVSRWRRIVASAYSPRWVEKRVVSLFCRFFAPSTRTCINRSTTVNSSISTQGYGSSTVFLPIYPNKKQSAIGNRQAKDYYDTRSLWNSNDCHRFLVLVPLSEYSE
jgi:hypothetical protein